MRAIAWVVAVLMVTAVPAYATITSDYTDFDTAKVCKIVDKAAEGEGEWVNFECAGLGSHKVYLFDDDHRQSINYGSVDENPAWESFAAPNHTYSKIEWRVEDDVPFATIHRWFVSDGEGRPETEVLIVEKTGQPGAPGGCAVALIRATGNAETNELAREIADTKARAFRCGDRAERIGDVPDFGREKF